MEEYISEEAKVPRYNEPIRVEEEGVWAVVADDPSHPSNNIHRTTPEANDDPQLVHTEIGDQNAFCCSGCCYDNEDNDNLYMLPVSANTSNTQTTASIQPNANSEGQCATIYTVIKNLMIIQAFLRRICIFLTRPVQN